MRRQKMESAALMLRDTERSVLEIAGCFGYDNGSKFSKAFKDILGVTPAVYRHRARTGSRSPRHRARKMPPAEYRQTEPYPALSERIRLRLSGILRS